MSISCESWKSTVYQLPIWFNFHYNNTITKTKLAFGNLKSVIIDKLYGPPRYLECQV